MKDFLAWFGKHVKGIASVIALLAGFYLLWALNIGGLISFYSVMGWSFEKLTVSYGFNPWLARFILIPVVAIFVYLVGMMLSITDRDRRNAGTVMMVILLSLVSLGMYYYTDDRADSNDLFDRFDGKPLKKYAIVNGELEIFPRNMRYHPIIGIELKDLDQQTYDSLEKKAKQVNPSELMLKIKPEVPWTRTEYQVKKGSTIRIIANGYIETPKSEGKKFGPEGFYGKSSLLKNGWGSPVIVIPEYGYAGLIAKVGENGTPFYVGSKFEMKTEQSGWLYLGINAEDCSENSGELSVYVSDSRYYPGIVPGLMYTEVKSAQAELSVTVKPEVPWTRTEYQVQKGDLIRIVANGYVITPKSNGKKFGPEGYYGDSRLLDFYKIDPNPIVISGYGYAGLIAKVGENGRAFYVGSKIETKAEVSGWLYLGINATDCSENSGELSVYISNYRFYPDAVPGLTQSDFWDDSGPIEGVAKINPGSQWTKTDFRVTAGEEIRIIANGYIRSVHSDGEAFGPEGYHDKHAALSVALLDYPGKLIADGGFSGLIAKIGENGQYFYVGSMSEFMAEESGLLYLGFNSDDCTSNSGEINVYLSRDEYYADVTPGLVMPGASN